VHNLSDFQARCKLTLTDGVTGTTYAVERLERRPGDYRKGFRLIASGDQPVFCHELPCGLQECSCPEWPQGRTCPHTELLTAAGLFDEPVRPDDLYAGGQCFPDDDLVDIDIDSDAP
jgi:hypothetical protein